MYIINTAQQLPSDIDQFTCLKQFENTMSTALGNDKYSYNIRELFNLTQLEYINIINGKLSTIIPNITRIKYFNNTLRTRRIYSLGKLNVLESILKIKNIRHGEYGYFSVKQKNVLIEMLDKYYNVQPNLILFVDNFNKNKKFYYVRFGRQN